MAVVVTACYSKTPTSPYDAPKPPPGGVDAAYAFTDDPLWYAAGWSEPPFARNNLTIHPRMRGKAPKAAPHLLGIEGDVLWLDSSMEWTGKSIASLFDLVPPGEVGCFAHRWRDCIYQEAEASLAPGFNRYTKEPIRQQVAHYRAMGHPEHAGLQELGCVVWRGAQHLVGIRWLAEMLTWTSQDQLSWPYVCRYVGVEPTILPGNAVENPWFRYRDHLHG